MSEPDSNQQPAVPDPAVVAGQERLTEPVVRTGMFGVSGSGDTSGYGGLQVRRPPRVASPRPYGSYFDEVADRLADALTASGSSFGAAVEQAQIDELPINGRNWATLTSLAMICREASSSCF